MIHETASSSLSHVVSTGALYRRDAMRTDALPLRIGLRLWGFDEYEVRGWGENLPTLGGRISWEIMHDCDADGVGAVIHLVRSSAQTLASFCWNCVGANRAIRLAQGAAVLHVAVFSGDARRLPTPRYGLWAIAGRRSEEQTVHEIARTLVFPRVIHAR